MQMIQNPYFSIITVCLNNLDGLKRTLLSVQKQTGIIFEWIVMDGGSSDGSVEFLSKLDMELFVWVSEKDDGLYDAMNKGIGYARGQYLIFLNSGDEFADDILGKTFACIEKSSSLPFFVYGDAVEKSIEGKTFYKKARSSWWIWYGMFTHHQSMFFSLDFLRDKNIVHSREYPLAGDYAFVCQVLREANGRVQRVYFPICIFWQGGISSQFIPQGLLEQWLIKREELKLPGLVRYLVLNLHILFYALRTKFGRKSVV